LPVTSVLFFLGWGLAHVGEKKTRRKMIAHPEAALKAAGPEFGVLSLEEHQVRA
jgi:hypothetical protein